MWEWIAVFCFCEVGTFVSAVWVGWLAHHDANCYTQNWTPKTADTFTLMELLTFIARIIPDSDR